MDEMLCNWFRFLTSTSIANLLPYFLQRKGRERKSPSADFSSTQHRQNPDDVWETKPLIAAQRKEAGEDFWIDPEDIKREKERKQAIANRKAAESEMPQSKLRSEIVAPYKQNWIGIISVLFIVLATIVKNFPQVLENPSIGFPDLDAGDPIPLQSTLTSAAQITTEKWIDFMQ